MVKLEVPTIVLIVIVLAFAFWVDATLKRPTMKKLDRQIFDGNK